MTIVKIHGVSGAGKTTAVRALIERADTNRILTFPYVSQGSSREGKYHKLEIPTVEYNPVYVLGDYNVRTGGIDSIGDVGVITTIVAALELRGHVVYEGLLTSTYYGAIGKDSQQYGHHYVYAFLDTPQEECVQRVMDRRLVSKVRGDYNPEPAKQKWIQVERLRRKVTGLGHNVQSLCWDRNMADQLIELLNLYD